MTPGEEYSRRLAAHEARARRLERVEERLGAARLVLAGIAIVLAGLSWYAHWIGALWIVLPAVAFAALVASHLSVRRRHSHAVRAADFYRRALGRIQDRWAGSGRRGERFDDPEHVYAADLDLFGEGGLFELLCEARTAAGEETLARWLLGPVARDEILRRHACVADLRERLDLREDFATAGSDAKTAILPHALLEWAESPNVLGQRWIRGAALGLPLMLAGAAVAGDITGLWVPFVAILLAEAAVVRWLRARLNQVLNSAESAFNAADLNTFAELLARLRREPFESAPMRGLVGECASADRSAADRVSQLGGIVALSEARENLIVSWFLTVPLLYAVHVALAAERWRALHGRSVRAWLAAAGRFEALSSLAQYAFEHPDDPLPELADGVACLCAEAIGHPLIARAQCVRNDVDLSRPVRALLVSGSNMSGKSTLLRAIGLNTVLAMAGAPVCARSMRLTVLQVGASIRVNDSLRDGRSRFYAEITRLRQLHRLAGERVPVLFLLDEILQGTNSKDRRIGAQEILGAFVEQGAIGLASTHDLALTELGGFGAGVVHNVHFEDDLQQGELVFDFKLLDGAVTKSNGLALMRAIGLPVREPPRACGP